jgi:putative transposase
LSVEYIDGHREEFGVEPICEVLQIAPSSYYAHRSRPPSARSVSDAATSEVIAAVHEENYGVYGARKVHAELKRLGHPIARCTVERLMKAAGLRGISRAKGPRTTVSGTDPDGRPDLVDRNFVASGPRQLWVADITYCRTLAGWVYAAFVIDVFSRRVVGWQLSRSLRTDLALDALEMGLWDATRDGHDTAGLVHHSDKGVQYLAIRYTQRLAETGAVASVGTTGDSYDNAMAEAFNSLFKAELVRNKGPWKDIDGLEAAVLICCAVRRMKQRADGALRRIGHNVPAVGLCPAGGSRSAITALGPPGPWSEPAGCWWRRGSSRRTASHSLSASWESCRLASSECRSRPMSPALTRARGSALSLWRTAERRTCAPRTGTQSGSRRRGVPRAEPAQVGRASTA